MKYLLVLNLIFLVATLIFGDLIYHYETKYIDMPVDHFTFSKNDTFKLRYLINDTFWKPQSGAPIFFYTGNEGDIVGFCNNTGYMWEIAPDFNALVVFAEHRYYGVSMPYGNASFSGTNLGFLTTSQALADYIELIYYIKSSYELANHKIPVIAFGGSYGGMLAAWIRMKYPATITGSLAASAPIWQFTGMTPCYAFNRVTTSAYRSTSEPCFECIKKSWKAFTAVAETADGKEWITKNFEMCQPIKTSADVQKLKDWLTNIYVNIAMVNYPYPANFLAELPANPVKAVCSNLEDCGSDNKQILMKIFKAASVYFNGTGSAKCLDVNADMTSTIGEDGWDYQACTEIIMPMCDDGDADMFDRSPWNVTQYSASCYKRYGEKSHERMIEKLYGGKDLLAASNIIFSNGLLDPWSSGGVLYNISKSVVAVLMPEAAHHLDLRASNPADPYSVRVARKYYRQLIKHWIADHRRKHYIGEELEN